MTTKKQSLFKQKLKQNKINIQQQNRQEVVQQVQTFPRVFKLQQQTIKNATNDKLNKVFLNSQNQVYNIQNQSPYETLDQQSSYLQKNKYKIEKIISDQQLNQIDQENWQTVNSMNEEQRLNYINLIQNTFPKHFIQKLKKKSNPVLDSKFKQQTIKNPQSIKNSQTKSTPQKIKSQKEYQNQQTQASKQNQIQGTDEQNQIEIMKKIHLNIKTQRLIYLSQSQLLTFNEEQKNNFVNLQKIYQFIKSENNQSQIIGSKLALQFTKNIYPNQNLVFYITSIPFLTRLITFQIYSVIKAIEQNIASTKHYSCYIQMIVKLIQILTLVYKNLTPFQLKQQQQFMKGQYFKIQKQLKSYSTNSKNQNSKNKQNDTESSSSQLKQKQMLYESIGIIYEQLNSFGQKNIQKEQQQKDINLYSCLIQQKILKYIEQRNKINDLIQAILLQQTLKTSQFQTFSINPSINQLLKILADFWDINLISKTMSSRSQHKLINDLDLFSTVLYLLVSKLNKKKRMFLFYKNLVNNIFKNLLKVIQQNYLIKSIQMLTQSKEKKDINPLILYRVLFVYRQLSLDSQKLSNFIQLYQQKWKLTQSQIYAIVYINFNHYMHISDLANSQIQLIQNMLKWLNNIVVNQILLFQTNNSSHKLTSTSNKIYMIDSQQILLSLLNLFLSSDQQIYSLIDPTLLFQIFKNVIQYYEIQHKNQQSKTASLLTQNQIKKFIQNYNYNSFGNDIFTKIIFWIAYTFSQDYEALLAEEVMMRYPMLFYYASEPIQSSTNTKSQNLQSTIKEEHHKNLQNKTSPLFGNKKYYIYIQEKTKIQEDKKTSEKQEKYFSHLSNKPIKMNLLKLLWMNLDFSGSKQEQKLTKCLLSTQQLQNTKMFQLTKSSLNQQNYFYKYLIQQFLAK